MAGMVKKVRTEVVEKYSAKITGDQLKEYLGLPKDTQVYFQVPGGADWSNERIDISADDPLIVSYEVVTVNEDF